MTGNKIKKYFEKSSFDYIKYDEQSTANQSVFKAKCEDLEFGIKMLMDGRSKETALIKLEECYMWIGKAVRDGQISRNMEFELQEGRKNGLRVAALSKLPVAYTDVDTLRDLIAWCVELKADRYSHRRLGGLEQLEYLRLAKTLDAANKMLAAMKRDEDDGK